jgi:hypothetical protein
MFMLIQLYPLILIGGIQKSTVRDGVVRSTFSTHLAFFVPLLSFDTVRTVTTLHYINTSSRTGKIRMLLSINPNPFVHLTSYILVLRKDYGHEA